MNFNSETEEEWQSDNQWNDLQCTDRELLVGNVILRNDFVNMYLNYIASQLTN